MFNQIFSDMIIIKFWQDVDVPEINDTPTLAKCYDNSEISDFESEISESDSNSDSEYLPSSSSSNSEMSGTLKTYPRAYKKSRRNLKNGNEFTDFDDEELDDADYSPSTPLYDEDEIDRFERLKFHLELQNDHDDMIRSKLIDIFSTSDEDI